MDLIGRKTEQAELKRLNESGQPEFVAIYGRRRVGKTFLIRSFFKDNFTFYTTGIARGTRKEQLRHFSKSLYEQCKTLPATEAADWYEAFDRLRSLIKRSRSHRKVVFLDELPWMDTQKSEFVKALELFWNEWGSTCNELMLIVCGSAASWMVNNIIKNKGGLHNRLTCRLRLSPFNLYETSQFLHQKGIDWLDETIAECYMILGGIPYYLMQIDKSYSLAQNIDRLFFQQNALLADEAENLYKSLFKKSEDYIRIIEALATKRSGLTREDIIKGTGLSNGGGLTRMLKELNECGFIQIFEPLRMREKIYQLSDFYTLFYYMFVSGQKGYDDNMWAHIQGKNNYTTWLGLSFERLCFAHLPQIRHALHLDSIATKTYSLYTEKVQMDMVIERADNVINLCEMKFTQQPYSLDKGEAEKIQKRMNSLQVFNRKKKNVQCVLVTKHEAKRNSYYNSMNIINLTLNDMISF
ncbi:MAG: ATP-binding protein [Paludibacteraceae bacterium]